MAGDWSPLAGRDPVPGDPGAVMSLVGRLDTTRGVIEEQVGRLRAVDAAAFWEGEAATAFRGHKDDLPPKLDMLVTRYQRVSGALSAYAPELDTARQMARRALEQARQAEADLRRAAEGIAAMEAHARREEQRAEAHDDADADSPPYHAQPWSGPDFHGLQEDAQADMAAARRLLEQAVDLRDRAAERAEDEIGDAIDDGLENEGGLFAGIRRGATWLVDNLPIEELATVAGIVAAGLALAVLLSIPGPGWLAGAALVAGLVSFGLDTVLFAAGDKDWQSWALSAFGVALGGAGAVAGRLAQGATVTTTVARQLTVMEEAMAVVVRGGQAGEVVTEVTAVARITQVTEIAHVTSLTGLGRVLTGFHDFARAYGAVNDVRGAVNTVVRLPDSVERVLQTDVGQPGNDDEARYRARTIAPVTIDDHLRRAPAARAPAAAP
jgi:hypothetical protein